MTRLCLAQKQRLAGLLAARGYGCHTVVIANDGNLDLAAEYGCHVIGQRNILGLKVNDGFQYALEHGADWVAFIGSDDWIHEDFFTDLENADPGRIIAGNLISVVDMHAGTLRRLGVRGPEGVSPWLVPRKVLERAGGRPVDDSAPCGMEGLMRLGFGQIPEVFRDPHDLTRVDFKTSENMTPYKRISRLLGYGNELDQPWDHLATKYGVRLADLARDTHNALALEVAA